MLIEGPGDLLLEDFRPASAGEDGQAAKRNAATVRRDGGLFGLDEDAGPSKTMIWRHDFMWYDFSIEQTRFQGGVELKHFSGLELARALRQTGAGSEALPAGRATFLDCDTLSVDFLERDRRTASRATRRMGNLSSERLQQFQAVGSVVLQDRGVSLTAHKVVYERDRSLLEILGRPHRPAHITIQEPGELPKESSADRFIYDITTGRLDAYKPQWKQ